MQIIDSVDKVDDGTHLEPQYSHDPHYILDRGYMLASSIICPRKVPEIQEIVKLADEFEIPLWSISIGRNTGYGGAAPRVRGSVVLNLGKHMYLSRAGGKCRGCVCTR